MKGEQPTQTTTNTVEMSPEQKDLFNMALPGVKSFAASVPQRYQGQTVAGFTDPQTQGQQMALGAAGQQNQLASAATASNTNLLQNLWDPATNPQLRGAVDAAVRPITENYQHVVQPGIRDEFATAQPFGGSRRGVADAVAGSKYLQNVGDTASKVVGDQYATNLATQAKALGLVPTTQQAQVQGAVTTSGVGDVQQNMNQQQINALLSGYNYDQLAPFLQSKELLSLIGGLPGGTSTATSTGNLPSANPLTSALGGAATGASLGNTLLPGAGALPGAGLGAMLAFLR